MKKVASSADNSTYFSFRQPSYFSRHRKVFVCCFFIFFYFVAQVIKKRSITGWTFNDIISYSFSRNILKYNWIFFFWHCKCVAVQNTITNDYQYSLKSLTCVNAPAVLYPALLLCMRANANTEKKVNNASIVLWK